MVRANFFPTFMCVGAIVISGGAMMSARSFFILLSLRDDMAFDGFGVIEVIEEFCEFAFLKRDGTEADLRKAAYDLFRALRKSCETAVSYAAVRVRFRRRAVSFRYGCWVIHFFSFKKTNDGI